MPVSVESEEVLLIEGEGAIVEIRRRVREAAEREGFSPFASAAITTATSEMARNVWRHAQRGEAKLEVLRNASDDAALRVTFSDQGPGIADVNNAMEVGVSSVRSLGLGLPGSARLVDEFDIQSSPGVGTVVTIVKWKRLS